jgi:hypothetical protein
MEAERPGPMAGVGEESWPREVTSVLRLHLLRYQMDFGSALSSLNAIEAEGTG